MSFEDRTLTCAQCGAPFVFSAGEQDFFAQRGLASEPKRCEACRKAAKQGRGRGGKRQQGGGEYRSPSFRGSAPEHQGGGRGPKRGPTRNAAPANRDYRAPAFRGKPIEAEADYRSPAFSGIDAVDPEDEYRAPGFKEREALKPEEEYRAPGFAEYAARWRDERPMFSVTCAACGEKAMVPFLPEEKERPLCAACHKAERDAALAAERAEIAAAALAAPAPAEDPAPTAPTAPADPEQEPPA
jgi:CxxC-x17-CxxC domain-containing protein